ncbi:MAG: hypothetical protein FWB90_04120 [Fibromonadales bacterium]|nr:hypothetical protein [Fibromonadales bacterium]
MVPLANTEVGKSLNSQKKHLRTEKEVCTLPQSQKFAMLMDGKFSFDDKVKFVENFIAEIGTIKAADGTMVNFKNPDYDGNDYSLKRRAEHLITRNEDKRDFRNRRENSIRIPFLEAMPTTVTNADLIAKGKHHGQNRIYHIKKYDKGTHLVITDDKRNVLEQGLLTQYPIDLNDKFDGFTITYKREGSTNGAFSSKSSLPPPTEATLPRPEAPLDHSEPTATLSNPDGVATSTSQTGGVPNSETDIDNIQISQLNPAMQANPFY